MKEQKVTTGLGWLEKMLQLEKQYGIWNILKSLGVLVITIWVIYLSLNPSILVEKYQEIVEDKHIKELTETTQKSQEIEKELESLLLNLGCERTFLIEYHNSVKSVEGCPWQFGSMNYEEVADNIEYFISDEFTEFITTKYSMTHYINKNNLFIGDINDIKKIDKRLAIKLESSNIKNLAIIGIEGEKLPIGILGVAYGDIEKNKVISELRKSAIKIGYIYYQ